MRINKIKIWIFFVGALLFSRCSDLYAQCEGNCADGEGKYIWPTGDSYEGKWKRGKQEGLGKLILASGDYYVGSWSEGEKEGPGLIYRSATKEFDLNYIIFGQTVISVVELDNGDIQFGYFKPGADGQMALYDGYSFMTSGLFKIEHGVKEQLNFDFKSDGCLIGDCKSGFGGEYKIDGENRYLRVGPYIDGKWQSAGGHYNFKDGFFFIGVYAPGTPIPCIKSGGQFNYETGVANFISEGQMMKSISLPIQHADADSIQSATNPTVVGALPVLVPEKGNVAVVEKNPTENRPSENTPLVQASASPPETPTNLEPSSNEQKNAKDGLRQLAERPFSNEETRSSETVSSGLTHEKTSAENQTVKKRRGAFWRTLGTIIVVGAVVTTAAVIIKSTPPATSTYHAQEARHENYRRPENSYKNESGEGCSLGYQKYICAGYDLQYSNTFGSLNHYRLNINLTNQGGHKVEVSVAYNWTGSFFNTTHQIVLEPGSRKTFNHEISVSSNSVVNVRMSSFNVRDISEAEPRNVSQLSEQASTVAPGTSNSDVSEKEKKLGRILFISNIDAELKIDGQKLADLKGGEAFKAFVNPGQIYVEIIPFNAQIEPKREVMDAPPAGLQVVKQLKF